MLVYSIIMFLTAAVFAVLSIAIYKGKTDLIHDYHQTRVADKAAYGKDFGKALSVISAALLLSGITSLCGNFERIAVSAVAVLIIGIGTGICCIAAVQQKHNKGFF